MKPTIITISFLIFISTCSTHQKDKLVAVKMIRLEKEIDSLNAVLMDYLMGNKIVSSDSLYDLRKKFNQDIDTFKVLINTVDWYKGRDFPFEPILEGLHKKYDTHPYKVMYQLNKASYGDSTEIINAFVVLHLDWNKEIESIKRTIMKTYKFEPTICKDRWRNDSLTWIGKKYDVKVYKSVGDKIYVDFYFK